MSSRKMSKDPEGSIEISGETLSSPEVFSVVTGVQNNVSSIQEHVEIISNKIIRIYLIRHYPSTDESDTTYYKTLDEIPKKERMSLEKVYTEIFSLPEKTLFMYDEQDGLERVRFTAEDLLKKYGTHIPVKNIIKDISLRGTYDDKEKPLSRKKRTINEMMELESVIKEQDLQDIDTIVIIGNRTYCEPFDLLSGGKKDILQKDLEAMGYLFRDFNGALEPILSKQDELKIHPEDFMDFQLLFPEIENKSCQNAQNLLVSKFSKEPYLFKKYLTDIVSPLSLRTFCLANLIKHEEYDIIETYYFSKDCQSLSEKEGMIFLQNIKKDRVRSLIRKLFISREEFWKDADPKVLKDFLGEQEYEILELNRESYKSSGEEQKRSLDNMIIQRAPGAILPRSVYYTKTDNRPEKINFNQIQEGGGKYILRAHVGQGKSFWLTEFVKYATFQKKGVVFYPAKTLGQKTTAEIDTVFDTAKQRQSILCIDAIDEILAENIKKYIKDKIERFQGACIITARESEYKPDKNSGFTGTLELSPIDAITFLKSRFQDDEAKFEYVYGILKKNHLDVEVEGNPLLLTLVVLLVSMTSEEKEEYKNIGILSLEDIKSKSDLYESISRFILAKHTKFIKGIACTKEELSGIDNGLTGKRLGFMDILGNIAYEIAKNLTSIGHESEIKDLITKDLSLLYFDTLTKSYQFANRSFYEFFLARYLTGVENGNKEITKLRDFWLTRNNSEQKNIIGYYIEILSGKDDKHDILVELMTSWLGFKSELFTKRGNFLSEGKNIEQKIGVCSDTNVLIEKLHGLPLTTLFSIILGDESQGKYEWEDSFFLNLEVLDKIQQKTNISQINHYYQMYSKSILEWDIDTVMHFRNLILKFSKITDKNSTPINNIIQKPWGVVNRGQNRILRFLSSIGSELSIKKTVEILDALAIDHRDYDVRNTYIELLENNSDSLLLIESPLRGLHTLIRKGCFYHALDAYLRFIDTGLKPYIIEVIEGAILFKKYGRVDEADSIYRKIVKLGVANFTNEAMRILAPIDDGNFLPDKH